MVSTLSVKYNGVVAWILNTQESASSFGGFEFASFNCEVRNEHAHGRSGAGAVGRGADAGAPRVMTTTGGSKLLPKMGCPGVDAVRWGGLLQRRDVCRLVVAAPAPARPLSVHRGYPRNGGR